MEDGLGVQPSKKIHATKYVCKALVAMRSILGECFDRNYEIVHMDVSKGKILDVGAMKNIPDTLGNWSRWPLKEARELTIRALIMYRFDGVMKKVRVEVVVIKFDHASMPGWVPVFGQIWYKPEGFANWAYNFDFSWLSCGECIVTPKRVLSWGDCAED